MGRSSKQKPWKIKEGRWRKNTARTNHASRTCEGARPEIVSRFGDRLVAVATSGSIPRPPRRLVHRLAGRLARAHEDTGP